MPEDSTRVSTQEDSIPTQSINKDLPNLSSSPPSENVGTPSLEEVSGNKESINQTSNTIPTNTYALPPKNTRGIPPRRHDSDFESLR